MIVNEIFVHKNQSNIEYKYVIQQFPETATQRYILGASSGRIAEFPFTICTDTEKLHSIYGSTLPKISIVSKKASNKNCSELNLVQKSPWVNMSISPWSGARAFERLACSKYVRKRQITFYLWLNVAKNTHRIKNLQIKFFQNWIWSKKVWGRICLLPPPPMKWS